MKPNKLALIHPVVNSSVCRLCACSLMLSCLSASCPTSSLKSITLSLFHPFINGNDSVPHACSFLLLHIFDSHHNTISLIPSISVCVHLLNAMRNKIDEGMNREQETPSPCFHEHPKIKEAHCPHEYTDCTLTFSTVLNIIYHHGPCQNE